MTDQFNLCQDHRFADLGWTRTKRGRTTIQIAYGFVLCCCLAVVMALCAGRTLVDMLRLKAEVADLVGSIKEELQGSTGALQCCSTRCRR